LNHPIRSHHPLRLSPQPARPRPRRRPPSEEESDMPTVSVLMPVHNARPYVAEALRSVLTQTLTDLEVVLIDDGSTDGTAAILDEFAQRDPRIRLIRQPNRG